MKIRSTQSPTTEKKWNAGRKPEEIRQKNTDPLIHNAGVEVSVNTKTFNARIIIARNVVPNILKCSISIATAIALHSLIAEATGQCLAILREVLCR